LATSSGCALWPDRVVEPQYHNPFPQIYKVAVLPFFNQSAEPTVDGEAVAMAYYNELQAIPGFEVMPVGVSKQMLAASISMTGREPRGGEEFQRLARQMGVDAVLVGSVTERVLRVAPCPVLAVGAADRGQDEEPLFRRVLCATDLAEPKSPTVEIACALAAENLAHVTLLHVVEELGADGGDDGYRFLTGIAALRRTLIAQAGEHLQQLAAARSSFGDVDTQVETGRPWKAIVRAARETGADLIVVGAHTGGAFGRLFLGSNADQVVRHAQCPVLVVRDGHAAPDVAAAAGAELRARHPLPLPR